MARTHIDPDIRKLARRMRKEPTDAERKLWRALRDWSPPGTNFRRQAPIGRYIADFACHTSKIVIEVDGGQHAEEIQERRDEGRTEWLLSQGYRVIRFWNTDVLLNMRGVLDQIYSVLNKHDKPNDENKDALT